MKTQELFNSISVRAIIWNDGQLLCEWYHPKDIYFLPGGRVEPGEDLRTALQRELAEELAGVRLEICEYRGRIGHRWLTSNGKDSCLNHFFSASIIGNGRVSAREAGRVFRWISLTSSEATKLKPPSLCALLKDPLVTGEWDLIDDEFAE